MELIKVKSYEEMSKLASSYILDLIAKETNPVLGLATGSTPEGLYQCMIEAHQQGKVSFRNTTTFNLDEYVGLSEEHPSSYNFYMQEKLFKHIDISPEKTFIPNGMAPDLQAECIRFEEQIKKAGQMDLQVLGIGLNGHIGFNEPGTSFSSRTHVVELTESTREANARFFDTIEEVPTKALTMGIETIMESKMLLLLVSGKNKAATLAQLLNGEVSEDFPGSVIKKHPNAIILADEEACQLENNISIL